MIGRAGGEADGRCAATNKLLKDQTSDRGCHMAWLDKY